PAAHPRRAGPATAPAGRAPRPATAWRRRNGAGAGPTPRPGPAPPASGPPLAQERAQPLEGPGVDDVLAPQPPALGHADPVAYERQVDRRMRVRVDGELHTMTAGPQDVLVVEIQAVRIRVDLERSARPGGGPEHRVQIELDAIP